MSRALFIARVASLHGWLQVLLKVGDDPVEQHRAHIGTGDRVRLAREDLQVVRLSGLDQLLNVLDRVLNVYIVVSSAMAQQQPPLQMGGGVDHRKVAIAVGEILGQAHVALGIDGVVVAPIGHRRHGHAGAKTIGVRERIEREGAAPAPSPPAQALLVQLRILGQGCIQDGQLILKLHRTQVAIGRLSKRAPPAAHTAIVGVQNGKAVLGEQLVEQQAVAPAIDHRLPPLARRKGSR